MGRSFSGVIDAAPNAIQNREQHMKAIGVLAACGIAALSAVASAQDASRTSSPGGDVDIQEVIARFARRANKQIVVDPRVRAQVPLAGITAGDLSYDQLLAVLNVHQFSVVNAGGILAVVPDANARQLPSPTYTDVNFKAADYEIVSLLVTPKKVCAAQLVPVLRPLMPQAAHLAAEIQTNTLIVNDRAVNARRIAGLVDQLDKLGTSTIRDCQQAWAAASKPKEKEKD
jgi:general secretion pathway protein D